MQVTAPPQRTKVFTHAPPLWPSPGPPVKAIAHLIAPLDEVSTPIATATVAVTTPFFAVTGSETVDAPQAGVDDVPKVLA